MIKKYVINDPWSGMSHTQLHLTKYFNCFCSETCRNAWTMHNPRINRVLTSACRRNNRPPKGHPAVVDLRGYCSGLSRWLMHTVAEKWSEYLGVECEFRVSNAAPKRSLQQQNVDNERIAILCGENRSRPEFRWQQHRAPSSV
jgi:hypothetical protein